MGSGPAEPGDGRRFLIAAAVTRVLKDPELDVPELAEDVERLTGLLVGELGYVRTGPLDLDPRRAEFRDTVRGFARDPDRRPDDYLVLYLAAHGEVSAAGEHHLLMTDTDPDDLPGTGLRPDDLVRALWEETPLHRVLLIFDTCYSGAAAGSAAATALRSRSLGSGSGPEPATTGLLVLSSSRARQETVPGVLTQALVRAIRAGSAAGNAPRFIPLDDVMAALSTDPEIPKHQRPLMHSVDVASGFPEFLPNPHYVPGAAGRPLDEIDRFVDRYRHQEAARREERAGHFLPRARGTDSPADRVWNFTGRHRALQDLRTWLESPVPERRLCVVTGDPGSGKSALLGLADMLSDPEYRDSVPLAELGLPADAVPAPGAIDVAIHASHKTTRQVLEGLSAAADVPAETVGHLIAGLQARRGGLTVLIDAVDEAVDPDELVAELLRPLATSAGGGPGAAGSAPAARSAPLRLLLGCRRHVADRLRVPDRYIIDLDDERYADPDAVRAYVRKLLVAPEAHPAIRHDRRVSDIAAAVAAAAGRSFLVALITARTIARQPVAPDPEDQAWRTGLPKLPGEAMERDLAQLGGDVRRALDLLAPLAFAQGAGLPWAGFWPELATAMTGTAYTDDDIRWLRRNAGSYVVEAVGDGGSVYRLYHRALIEYVRGLHNEVSIQARATRALRSSIIDWPAMHPYPRRYLAMHAAEGGVLDELLDDAEFVLCSDPDQLTAALPSLRTEDGRRAGRAVRQVLEKLPERTKWIADSEALTELRFAAVCHRAEALAASCDNGPEPLRWRARWAVWNPRGPNRDFGVLASFSSGSVVVPHGDDAYFVGNRSGTKPTALNLDDGSLRILNDDFDRIRHDEIWSRTPAGHAVVIGRVRWGLSLTDWDQYRTNHPDVPAEIYGLTVVDFVTGTSRSWNIPSREGDAGALLPIRDAAVVAPTPHSGHLTAAVLTVEGTAELFHLTSVRAGKRLPRRRRRSLVAEPEEGGLAHLRRLERRLESAHFIQRVDGRFERAAAGRERILLTTTDGDVAVLSTQYIHDPSPDRIATGHTAPITDLCEAADRSSTTFLTASMDGSVRAHVADGRSFVLLKASIPYLAVAAHRSGRQWLIAAIDADGAIHRADLDSGRRIGAPLPTGRGGPARLTVCRLAGTTVVIVQGSGRLLQIYDFFTGERLGGHRPEDSATAVGRDRRVAVTGSADGLISVLRSERIVDSTYVDSHEDAVLAVAEIPGPHGRAVLVSVGRDHWIRCRDLVDLRELWKDSILRDRPPGVLLLTCATVVVTGPETAAVVVGDVAGRLWTVLLRGGLPERRLRTDASALITAVCATEAEGRWVGAATTIDGEAVCWELTTGRWLGRSLPAADPEWVRALTVDPGDGDLVALTITGHVHRWRLPSCRMVAAPRSVPPLIDALRASILWNGSALTVAANDATGGLIGGLDDGYTVRLRRHGDGSWRAESYPEDDAWPWTVTVLESAGVRSIAVGCHGELQLRSFDDGRLLDRWPALDAAELLWSFPLPTGDGSPPSRVATLSAAGMVEHWTVAGDTIASRKATAHDRDSRPHLAVGADGTETLIGFAVHRGMAFQNLELGPVGVLDFPDHLPRDFTDRGAFLLTVDGRRLAFLRHGDVVTVLEFGREHFHRRFACADPRLLPLRLDGESGILVCNGDGIAAITTDSLLKAMSDPPISRRAKFAYTLRLLNRRWLDAFDAPPPFPVIPLPQPAVRRSMDFRELPSEAVPAPDDSAFALVAGESIHVVSASDDPVRTVDLGSRIYGLVYGPDGHLVVATRNGLVLIDPLS